jgi:acyl-CoA thioester hydrolase
MFYDEGRTLGENDCHFVVKRIEADYFKPAFLGDIIDVKIEVLEIKGASANILHTIYRGDDKLFSAKILIALVKNGKPIRMPESEVEFFKKKILN